MRGRDIQRDKDKKKQSETEGKIVWKRKNPKEKREKGAHS